MESIVLIEAYVSSLADRHLPYLLATSFLDNTHDEPGVSLEEP